MAFNPAGSAEVAIDVFGSWVTEMAPSNLPAGVSPDNQDVVFVPGSVGARPALQKVFNPPFPSGGASNYVPTMVYGKSFVTPDGIIKNLYMDSNGNLYVEDLTNTPGVYTLLLASAAGSYCKSVTAFGREYIAISDGLHGSEVPLQYDGTNLDRVTQDGPGAPPTVSNLILPPATMVASGAAVPLTVTSMTTTGLVSPGHDVDPFYTQIRVIVTSGALGLTFLESVTVAGNAVTNFNATFQVESIASDTVFYLNFYDPNFETGAGGTCTPGSGGTTASRSGNIVTVTTATDHKLQVGFRAQIGGIPAATVGTSVPSIVINNEDAPGIATITTSAAHGLVPGCFITLNGITAVGVGGAIASAVRHGENVTITLTTAHGATPGSSVTIAGVTDTSFNGTFVVEQVPSPTTLVYTQASSTDATSSAGTVSLNWPIQATALPSYFEIIAAPSATTFQVAISYADGTWTSGTVKYAWDGTFYVTNVIDSTTFQYQQYGPDATTSTAGTVTPIGQVAPGKHQLRVSFLTRQGYITRPSPPVTFTANGGQYLSVSNLPIGPSNVVGRIVELTGSLGSYFYYLLVPGQVNGQVVSTATAVNDNTTTNLVIDISDPTLYTGISTSIPGNNTPNQIVLDGALGFNAYAQRLIAYGQRNRIQNLLNMSFDGGYYPTVTSVPLGWTVGSANGALSAGHFGEGWLISCPNDSSIAGELSQSAYEDCYGAPILTGSTNYKIRIWLQPSVADAGLQFKVVLSSVLGAFTSTATITGDKMNTAGGWVEADFDTETPTTILSDMTLTIYAQSSVTATLLVDEQNIIYADNPYLDTVGYGSYVDNPEAFDGTTGKFGAADDTKKLMDMGSIRSILYLFTQEPSGRLHETSDNGLTEPSGWNVSEVAANCGVLSAFCLTKSQADDNSASGGEEWLAWASETGARIYGGSEPWKISQEIQPNWFDPSSEDATVQINMQAALSVWCINDPVLRVIYFGLPIGTALAPTLVYPMNYREMESAEQIHNSPPVHISLTGKVVSTDNTRKWTRWNMTMNGGARMYRESGELTVVLFGGNGQELSAAAGHGNVYTLNPNKMTDDDYGLIAPYYITALLPTGAQEEQLQLDGGRKLLSYFSADVSGVGNITVTAFCNNLSNAWPFTCIRSLYANPNFDMEWGGASVQAQRMAFKFASSPLDGQTDNTFNLQKVVAWLRKSRILVRGAAQ